MKRILAILLLFVLAAALIVVAPFVARHDHLAPGMNPRDVIPAPNLVNKGLQHLVEPAPLSKAHAKYENDCTICHAPFAQTSQNVRCLVCHKDVQDDIDHATGFHGRSTQVKDQSCKACHAEHKGRDAPLVTVDRATFQHELTGFKLVGAHAAPTVTCENCHLAEKKFREAPTDCYSCHKKDDHHQGRLGTKCADCHKETVWKDAIYDHGKTKFPLTGKHKDVTCVQCHVNESYKDTPKDCLSCHKINDVHADTKQTACDKCHVTDGWRQNVKFDHNKETKFPLKNGHSKATCEDCHKNLLFAKVAAAKCVDCHQVDDVHHGRNGPKCSDCHNDTSWKTVSFDHDRDTKFRLVAKHKTAQCDDCHKRDKGNDKRLDMSCVACHHASDVHKGSLGRRCNDCHNERGWNTDVAFDHDLTKFPLIGLHATTACGACHLNRDYKAANTSCASCHTKDDFHKGTQGEACQKCHNPNGWKMWRFDHNTTKFPLAGAHEGLSCAKCHTVATKADKLPEISTGCFGCHEKQNKHGYTYGTVYKQCDLCHGGKSFRDLNDSKIKKFHKPPYDAKVDLEENCGSCHQKDDVHQGGFGNHCGQCHTVDKFDDLSRMER